MIYQIRKCFEFSAAHHLPSLPPTHKCARPHGHNYVVEVVLESDTLNEHGFVTDYADLDAIKAWLDATWDHKDLNALGAVGLAPVPTTAEALANFLFQMFVPDFPAIVEIRVSETPKTWASARKRP